MGGLVRQKGGKRKEKGASVVEVELGERLEGVERAVERRVAPITIKSLKYITIHTIRRVIVRNVLHLGHEVGHNVHNVALELRAARLNDAVEDHTGTARA